MLCFGVSGDFGGAESVSYVHWLFSSLGGGESEAYRLIMLSRHEGGLRRLVLPSSARAETYGHGCEVQDLYLRFRRRALVELAVRFRKRIEFKPEICDFKLHYWSHRL